MPNLFPGSKILFKIIILILLISGAVFLLSKSKFFSSIRYNPSDGGNAEINSGFLPQSNQSKSPAPQSAAYKVARVIDGDTMAVEISGKTETVRLIGVNAPESVDPRRTVECFGKESSDKAKEILNNKSVKLEMDEAQEDRDKYGRLLRYVFLEDGTNFNKMMITGGFAYEYTYDLPYKYQSEFKEAEKEAREAQKGLWAQGACDAKINSPKIALPINSALDRVTKKPFGIKISPADSPVQPERFSGYHTGTDFEIFSGEENIDVPIYAICDGELIYKNRVNGYGGVVVEKCQLENQDVTIIYGHLKLSSVEKAAGQEISAGEKIGVLGAGYSAETDGERKHLHLGIKKGSKIDFRGYVQGLGGLEGWVDVMGYLR